MTHYAILSNIKNMLITSLSHVKEYEKQCENNKTVSQSNIQSPYYKDLLIELE